MYTRDTGPLRSGRILAPALLWRQNIRSDSLISIVDRISLTESGLPDDDAHFCTIQVLLEQVGKMKFASMSMQAGLAPIRRAARSNLGNVASWRLD